MGLFCSVAAFSVGVGRKDSDNFQSEG